MSLHMTVGIVKLFYWTSLTKGPCPLAMASARVTAQEHLAVYMAGLAGTGQGPMSLGKRSSVAPGWENRGRDLPLGT